MNRVIKQTLPPAKTLAFLFFPPAYAARMVSLGQPYKPFAFIWMDFLADDWLPILQCDNYQSHARKS